MKNDIKTQLGQALTIFDGAMGTMLQEVCQKGEQPDLLNITHPELITKVHTQYVEAGSHIITANTFGANALKLKGSSYSVDEIIGSAISNARKANAPFVALDIGPLGQLVEPLGTLAFESAVELFAEQVRAGDKYGADVVLIETMSDLLEIKSAIIAVKENSNLPIIVSLTFEENNRTFMGVDALTAVTFLNAIGVDAIGINCSRNPFDIAPIVDTFMRYSRMPVMVMPNAGLPLPTGKYSVSPKDLGRALVGYYKKGARIFGGCCGTRPEYIAELKKLLNGKKPLKKKPLEVTAITSGTRTEIFDDKITIIGERINPTGKPKLKDAIKNNDMGFVVGEAIAQQENGATVLDVNCGLPDIDEPSTLASMVKELQSVISLPLQIDSANPMAIEKAVRVYNGKPLINSVTGEQSSMDRIFPIVKKYGAAVIGLTLDQNGIPKKAAERLQIAKRIVQTAQSYGIPKKDIFIDCLVLTASAQQEQVFETVKAIQLVKQKLGVKTVLGVSNVSFGLPNRAYLNSIFLTSAMTAGLDAGIVNPMSDEIMSAVKAFRVLNGYDKGAEVYIEAFRQTIEPSVAQAAQSSDLIELIATGQKKAAVSVVTGLLGSLKPLEIINKYLVKALDIAGRDYESGKIFLPRLIKVAETAKACFEIVKQDIKLDDQTLVKGKIILATVKGDIHDIGKNIVKVLLQSYGYSVIDLGKDVDGELVAGEVVRHNVKLVGLSALMTTTIPAMKDTIEKIRKVSPTCKIMVGGAVLNQEYAKYVGADHYAQDAMAGIKIAELESKG